jgi:hypothetical protein
MANKKNNTNKATTPSVKDEVVATAPPAEVTTPVVEETETVAEVTTPVVEAPKSSLKIGNTDEAVEFLQIELADGRKFKFKVNRNAQIGVFGSIWTPEKFCKESNEAKLLEFFTNHPRYFNEVFE